MLLTSVVLDAFDLIAGDQLDLVRECEAEECTRLFVDSSHGRTRRWCGMAECGNRAKVRAYRQRHEAASAADARSRRA
ncbi:MAG: CGNR zinc finger domain-containing protein [Jatrophihabitans sp.]|uniref:CGNR zinc finger domain-containing protein n=1 Tax=Jatrophihabitans sp. TaxID=1932789 RepID=UPI0039127555